ncbi:MAG: hypothetical protein DLM60_17355 [Pseudonocardiales bacterium]|nr:MAG: hypothetical protein DLM60_17355 [Pseudonocardiales bacterium]
MGTWGFLPLDNDTAADWCGELNDAAPSERPEMVDNALKYIIETKDNMGLDNTQVAIAAAAVVASQLEDGPLMTSAYGPDFILAGGSLDVAHLAPLAAQALNKILNHRASAWRSEFIEEIEKLHDILASSCGRPRPEVQWSAVATKGFSDRPAQSDLLQRSSLIEVIVGLLSPMRNSNATSSPHEGPQVICIEGAWGSGKTSVMHLIASELKSQAWVVDYVRHPLFRPWSAWKPSRITPFMAHRLLGIWRSRPIPTSSGKYTPIEKYESEPMPVVATFEPWAHQSSEQVWAALARTITQAGTEALYKSEGERRKYWLSRNAERVDTTPLRQALWRGIASPLLRVSIFALIVPIVVQLLRPDTRFSMLGIGTFGLAWLLPALLLAAGLAHTVAHYLLGRADAFLPEEMFMGPVLSGVLATSYAEGILRDPLHHARSGSLYLVQHDVKVVLDEMRRANREMVLFVDDLDRCAPDVTVEVLQAINLFMSGQLHGCRFVLGLDQAVVAAQISEVYGQEELAKTMTYGDDPTLGWSFLRKMIQLPVILPRLTDNAVEGYVRALLGDIETQVETIERLDSESQQSSTTSGEQAGDMAAERPKNIGRRPSLLERHPEVREVLRNRLAASNGSSGRETKRFLTVWQFYLRVTINSSSDMTLSNGVLLARRLVFASEIIVRWPAYLRQLCKPVDGKSALILLAENVDNDLEWTSTLAKIGLDKPAYFSVAKNLRSLLRCDDSKEIAILTMHLI